MAIETRYICDRCKREIEKNRIGVGLLFPQRKRFKLVCQLNGIDEEYITTNEVYELCSKCTKKLEFWLKTPESEC